MKNNDPILKGEEKAGKLTSEPEELSTYEEIIKSGYYELDIEPKTIERMGETFNQLFIKNKIERNGLTYLKGVVFALGSKRYNPEWREHCASSLRELFHHWGGDDGKISTAFNTAFRSFSRDDKFTSKDDSFPNSKNSTIYFRFRLFYNFFSSVCHHNIFGMTKNYRLLYGEDVKGNDISEAQFIKVVRDFINEIKYFFNQNIRYKAENKI